MASGRSIVGQSEQVVRSPSVELVDQFIGFVIVAVLPALFWAAALAAGSALFSFNLQPTVIAAVATIIFLFLGGVWACFAVARNRSHATTFTKHT